MDRPEHPTEHLLAAWHRRQGMSISPPVTLPRKFSAEVTAALDGLRASFRILRRKQLVAVPPTDAEEVPDGDPLPNHILDAPEGGRRARGDLGITRSVCASPATLFFVHECSHLDVACICRKPEPYSSGDEVRPRW